MFYRLRQPLNSRGFVLLHTLWLLLLIAALLAATLQAGRRMADGLSSSKKNIQVNLSSESAVYDVIFELLEKGVGSRWIRENGKIQTVLIDSQVVEVTSSNVHGMIDVNSADERLLRILLASMPSISYLNAFDIRAQRQVNRFSSYSNLSARLTISQRNFACLYPYITLFSGRSEPSVLLLSEKLIKMIGKMGNEKSSVMEGNTLSVTGEVFRINVGARVYPPRENYLSVEVMITGRRDVPYLIRSWNWVPNCQIG